MFKNNFWNSTLIFGLGFVFIRAISFLLLPIYTNILSPAELGIIFIFITFLAFMNSIYTFGMDSALLKYYQPEGSTLFTSFISIFIFAIPISSIIFLSGNFIESFLFQNIISINSWIFKSGFWILAAIIILLLDSISSRAMTLIRIANMPWYYLMVALLNIASSLILNIYLLYFSSLGSKLDGVIFSILTVSIIQFISLMPILVKKFHTWQFDLLIFKKMLRFAWPFFPATIFFIIIELSDRIMIEKILSTRDVGLYGAGYKIGALMLMLVRGFNLNWQPYYLKSGEKLNALVVQNFSYIGNIVLLCFILITGLTSSLWPYLISIHFGTFAIIGENFVAGGKIIPYILISYTFYGFFILQMPSIYLKNKQNWAPLLWGAGAAINIVGNIVLLPRFGYYGAAISTLLAYSSMSIILLYKNYSWLWIPYNFKFLFSAVFISGIQYFLISYMEYNIIITITLYTAIMIGLIYYIKINGELL